MLDNRFWDKVKTSDTNFYKGTPCWEWVGCTHPKGYGQFWYNGKTHIAHRVSYEDAKDKISKELQLDHLCRNRKCVNPGHLEPVTPKENSRRGLAGFLSGLQQRLKTHCAQGHEYSKENTFVRPNGIANVKFV